MVNEATGSIPALVFFGRQLFHPLVNAWNLNGLTVTACSEGELKEIWAQVASSLKKYHGRLKRLYDVKHHSVSLNVNDLVLVESHYLSSKVDKFTQKLAPKFQGPWRIERFLTPVTALLSDDTNNIKRKAHVSQLKLFHSTK